MLLQKQTAEIIPVTPSGLNLPVVIAAAGERASRRFVEFFTANIRNKNTREAYARAIGAFLGWCDHHHLALETIEPVAVAASAQNWHSTMPASIVFPRPPSSARITPFESGDSRANTAASIWCGLRSTAASKRDMESRSMPLAALRVRSCAKYLAWYGVSVIGGAASWRPLRRRARRGA